jgi:alkanesulfonate monooxygenase SsuD/methylene tetrahydromethanopterin reductase-like flavin-dependent oxidoreductase (luciferase family)
MVRPLRVGIQLPEAERAISIHEYLAMAGAAEDAGFDSVWVGDHLLYRDEGGERGPIDAMPLLAALATATTRIRLGPLVACLPFRQPAVLAKMVATVAEIGGGRFTLGVGAGWNEAEFLAFGIPFQERVDRTIEGYEIVRRLLAGERVTFAGAWYRTEDAVLLPRPSSRIPLMVGTTGPRMLQATLPTADAWNLWGPWHGNDPTGFAAQNARVSEVASRVGRDPRSIARSVCVFTAIDLVPGEEPVDEEVDPLTGTDEDIARGLIAFADAGADEAILVPSPNTERAIRAFGEVLELLDR